MTLIRRARWLLLAALPACAATAAVPAEPRYNVVEFRAETRREVRNDLFNATLYAELDDASAAALADALNKRVNDALRAAKDEPGVRVRSGNNQTYPVYSRNNVLRGWRGRAEIRIEGKDFDAASALIGKLQTGMQLAGMGFSVSSESRRAVEDELSVEAIRAFKARAEVLKTALGGRRWKLVRLEVSAGQQGPQLHFATARAAAGPEVAPPQLESGVTSITVVASGTIEILD
jgi:predicted secreted protein